MVILNLVLLLVFLVIVVKATSYSIKYSSKIARDLHFPEFLVSFFIIALISVLPEATIAIISAIRGEPEMSLGTLLGSNIADLTLVFGVVALFSSRGIKIKSKILNDNFIYLILLLFPLLLGLDGTFSRIDGVVLLFIGLLFFAKVYTASRRLHKKFNHIPEQKGHFFKDLSFLILSLIIILIAAFLTVKFSVAFANEIKLPTVLIGITIIAIGTCLPELVFSLKAVKENRDSLALGDIFGTVITDATIILGLVALISPFSYSLSNIYITGSARVLSVIVLALFMKSEKSISKIEGILLIFFYILFVFAEFFANRIVI